MVSITCNKYTNGYIKDHIFELREKISVFFNNYGHITNSECPAPSWLDSSVAVERCTGIAEATGSNTVIYGKKLCSVKTMSCIE